MTWKDALLIFWIFLAMVLTFAARHFLGGASYLLEHIAASSVVVIPGLVRLLAGHLI